MNTEFIKDSTGKIVDIKVNGKPVKRGYMRGFKKAQECLYFNFRTQPAIFTNPFSGVSVELNPLEATIYDFCQRWYRRYSAGIETGAPIQTFDDMKYFLNEINPSAYMDLLD